SRASKQAVPAMTLQNEPHSTTLTLPVTGMTCASCVRRIEKALSRVEGVRTADVNLATENAHVVFDPSVASVEQMRAAVEKAGYSVGAMPALGAPSLAPKSSEPREDALEVERQREIEDLKRKWTLSLAAGLVMMALM